MRAETIDPHRLDLVLQYALAVAGNEDFGQRELGPIHLIKYAYLGDLAYAEKHDGETYTGVPWRFYHFGPWALEVNDRIEPAAQAVGATRRSFTNAKYEGELLRFQLQDEGLAERLLQQLPWEVTSSIRQAVHEYTNDTNSLLDHVYRTAPMLRTAPGESLVFRQTGSALDLDAMQSTALRDLGLLAADGEPDAATATPTWKQRRAKKERIADLRLRVRRRLEERSQAKAPVAPLPRYDEVFFDGVEWLDDLAGDAVKPGEAEAVFSADIWKSPTRSGRDVP